MESRWRLRVAPRVRGPTRSRVALGREVAGRLMSESQHCEFRAIDRGLTGSELKELQALSSRVKITSPSFANTYNCGDFRGDPGKLIEKCFDAFVYVANWGTHELMLLLAPAKLLQFDAGLSLRVGAAARHANTFCSREFPMR